jgi:hypothetical protein
MPCKSTRTLIHHFTSSPQGHGQRQATHRGGQHSIKEAHHSRVSFLLTCFLLSCAISCLPLLVFSILDLLTEEIFGTEETLEYISSNSGVDSATLNGILLYYRLMTKWSGLGGRMELSRVGLSH